jgi:hypothetical protein
MASPQSHEQVPRNKIITWWLSHEANRTSANKHMASPQGPI